jgi:hypothetical protein
VKATITGTLTKAELNMLEKIFAAEIEHGMRNTSLPFCYQSKAKIMDKLKEKDLIAPITFKVGNDAMAVTISGWALTHSGRFTYCANL